MARYEGQLSLELEIYKTEAKLEQLKQTELLDKLFLILEPEGSEPIIEGFQRMDAHTYVIAFKDKESRRKAINIFVQKQEHLDLTIQADRADIKGGRLTISGCPNEYPNEKLGTILSKYVQIKKVKDGLYKNHQRVRNGSKHITFQKILTPWPTRFDAS